MLREPIGALLTFGDQGQNHKSMIATNNTVSELIASSITRHHQNSSLMIGASNP